MDMFLSMLTADAASRHGHEFSSRTASPAPRLPNLRSPLSVLPSGRYKPSPGPSPLGPGKRTIMPKRSKSLRVTMTELLEEPEDDVDDDHGISKLRIPGAFHPLRSRSRSLLNLRPPDKVEVPAAALEVPTAVASSVVNNFAPDEALPLAPISKRIPRSKTQYRLAHPLPATKTKPINKHIRPRVLLQLQQQASSGFHRPVYEVVPASRFANNTRIGQKLNKLHKLRGRQLADDDLVVIEIEDYKTLSDVPTEELESFDGRCVLGIICASASKECQGPDGALICLENSCWKATAEKDGRYDFVLVGDEAQRARWYLPRVKRKQPSSIAGPQDVEDRKFYFAPIQPNSTKHPTVASMNNTGMDVYDFYSPRAALSRSSSVATSTDLGAEPTSTDFPNNPLDHLPSAPIDQLLRNLIIISGSWVFFKEGWSPYFEYPSHPILPTPKVPSLLQPIQQRSASFPVEGLVRLQHRPWQESSNPITRLVRSSTTIIRPKRNSLTVPQANRNSASLSPSASSSERSPSPISLRLRKTDSVHDKPVRLGALPNITFTSPSISSPSQLSSWPNPAPAAAPTPNLESLPSLPKQVTFVAPPTAPPLLDGQVDNSDESEDSESPIISPYWKDFDKLIDRRNQQQMMDDGSSGQTDLRVYALHGNMFTPQRSAALEPLPSVHLQPTSGETTEISKGGDPPTIARANTESAPASVSDSTQTVWGTPAGPSRQSSLHSSLHVITSRQPSVGPDLDTSAGASEPPAREEYFKLRSKLRKWEALMKSKGELAGARAKQKKAVFDLNQKRKKEEKEKRKEQKLAMEKNEKEEREKRKGEKAALEKSDREKEKKKAQA